MTKLCRVSAVVAAFVLLTSACAEDSVTSYVEGSVDCDKCVKRPFLVSGSLGDGEDYEGYCTKNDDEFSFGVGTVKPGSGGTQSDFYLSINGVVGKPVIGALDSTGSPLKASSSNWNFNQVTMVNVNLWRFDSGDVDPQECEVRIFAEAKEFEDGTIEVVPGSENYFDYYLDFLCTSIDEQMADSNGQVLGVVSAKLFFSGC